MDVPLFSAATFVGQADLAAAVAAAIDEAKAGDPMAPVYVLAPSGNAGQSLSRQLARTCGVINVRFFTLPRLAEALIGPDSTPDRPRRLSTDLRRELTRLIALRAQPPLDSSASPALVQTLSQAFNELRTWSDLQLEALDDANPLSAELVRLYRSYVERAAPYADERALVEAAEAAIGAATPPIISVVFEPPTTYEGAFLEAVERVGRLRRIVLLSGDQQLDQALHVWFGGLAAPTTAPLPAVDGVIVAPDAEVEVQLAVTRLLEAADAGVPFPRMALLYGARSPYALLIAEHLRAAGIPWSGWSALRLAHSVVGRFVTSLSCMRAENFSYAAVMDWLSSSPIIDPRTGDAAPVSTWRAVARRARLAAREGDWAERLNTYADAIADEDRKEATQARLFARFMGDLAEWCGEEPVSWKPWTVWVQDGIHRYLGNAEERRPWGGTEEQAALDVERCLLRMSRLDELRGRVSSSVFAAALADELQGQQARGSRGEGVFTGTFADAIGCTFDIVVGCGLAEGVTPAPTNQGGVLAALHAPGVERRAERERRAYLLGLASGRQRYLSCPRADQRAQRELRPSPWLLEQATALAGASVLADDIIGDRQAWPWLDRVPSFRAALSHRGVLATEQLLGLQRLASSTDITSADVPVADERFRRGVNAIMERDSDNFTEYDGHIGEHDVTELPADQPLSPTRLEDWATCPFRYYLKTVLRLAEPSEEEDLFGMDACDRGRLVHRVLEDFMRDHPRTSPTQRWTADERAALAEHALDLYRAVSASGRSPAGLLREGEEQTLLDNLATVLDEDESMRAELGVVPSAAGLEAAFGFGEVPAVAVDRGPERTPVMFRGRIDRVDRSLDGSRVVTFDYKTGRKTPEYTQVVSGDRVAAGTKLQLAIYAMHAAATAPDAEVRTAYWFTKRGEKEPRPGFIWDDDAQERARAVIGSMAEGIEGGVFPLVPGDEDRGSYKHCQHCPYDSLCPADRAEAWERKQRDQAVSPFHALQLNADADD